MNKLCVKYRDVYTVRKGEEGHVFVTGLHDSTFTGTHRHLADNFSNCTS